jgi:hypothetical protein
MKSAYEIAMERLEKASGPGKSLSDEQKAAMAEVEKKFSAKIAEARIDHEARLAVAPPHERAALQTAMAEAVRSLEEKRDREKDALWNEAGA